MHDAQPIVHTPLFRRRGAARQQRGHAGQIARLPRSRSRLGGGGRSWATLWGGRGKYCSCLDRSRAIGYKAGDDGPRAKLCSLPVLASLEGIMKLDFAKTIAAAAV